ncbi:MAG: rRNA maturation RNase YbeY [Phycisphaerales bacterium]|jgi:probable rRNA maturation factor
MFETLSITLTDQTTRLIPMQLDWLTRHIHAAVTRLGGVGEVRVAVVDDAAMAQAHQEFAGVAGTTDVLTFDLSDPEAAPPPPKPTIPDVQSDNVRVPYPLDTDIMVCLDEASRQAARRGYSIEKELLLYVVHGVLHCLGWDDHEDEEAARMHEVEDAVLIAIGVGAAYASRDGSEPPGEQGDQ